MRKFCRWVNNHILPISYKLWKQDQDKVYEQLDDTLKPDWISAQHSVASMPIPFIIFVLVISFDIAFRMIDFKYGKAYFFFLFFGLLYGFVNFMLTYFWYDKYADEKYLELSKEMKTKKLKK